MPADVAAAAPLKPIRGFGVVGWIGGATLLAILGALGAGVDIPVALVNLVAACVGERATDAFVSLVIWQLWLLVIWPSFNLVRCMALVVAFHIAPQRHLSARRTLLVYCIVAPMFLPDPFMYAIRSFAWLAGMPDPGWLPIMLKQTLGVLNDLVGLILLVLATRSWRAVAPLAICSGVWWALTALTFRSVAIEQFIARLPGAVVGVGWQIVAAASVGWWAVRERRLALRRSRDACEHCAYSLVGLPKECPCPECGSARASYEGA